MMPQPMTPKQILETQQASLCEMTALADAHGAGIVGSARVLYSCWAEMDDGARQYHMNELRSALASLGTAFTKLQLALSAAESEKKAQASKLKLIKASEFPLAETGPEVTF